MENQEDDVISSYPAPASFYKETESPNALITTQKPLVYNYEDGDEQLTPPTPQHVPTSGAENHEWTPSVAEEQKNVGLQNGNCEQEVTNNIGEEIGSKSGALYIIPFANPCPAVSDPDPEQGTEIIETEDRIETSDVSTTEVAKVSHENIQVVDLEETEVVHDDEEVIQYNDDTMDDQSLQVDETLEEQSLQVDETVEEQSLQVDETVEEQSLQVDETVEDHSLEDEDTVDDQSLEVDETTEEHSLQVDEIVEEQSLQVDETVEENPLQADETMEENPLQADETVEENPLHADETVEENPLQVDETVEEHSLQVDETDKPIEEDDIDQQLARLHQNGSDDCEPRQLKKKTLKPDQAQSTTLPSRKDYQNSILDDWDPSTDPTDDEAVTGDTENGENNCEENEPLDVKVVHSFKKESDLIENVIEVDATAENNVEEYVVVPVTHSEVEQVVHTFSPPNITTKRFSRKSTKPASNVSVDEAVSTTMTKFKARGFVDNKELMKAIEILEEHAPPLVKRPEIKEEEIVQVLGATGRLSTRNIAKVQPPQEVFVSTLDQKRVQAYARRGQGRPSVPGRGRGVRGGILRPPPVKKLAIDRGTERELALQQLAMVDSRYARKRASNKNAPIVAAADLGRALASTPVLTGKRKEPCYKPKTEPDVEAPIPPKTKSSAIKTYSPPVRGAVSDDVATGLQTIAIVNKVLSDSESIGDDQDVKSKKKKRPRELQNLLGDEGAVRMIYDTAQKNSPEDLQPIFKKTKRGLEQQTKYVENAVMRLSGAGASEKKLRGKRLKPNENDGTSPLNEDPLFPPAAPGDVETPQAGRSRKKKQKPAEASRILYRHSSSESFDGSEGIRRTSSEIAGLDAVDKNSPRKSSRPRKVSSKLSDYVATSSKKGRKDEAVRDSPEAGALKKEVIEPMDEGPPPTPPPSTSKQTPRLPKKKIFEEVRVTRSDGIFQLLLTSKLPMLKNAFNVEVFRQLQVELEKANKDPSCQAIVLASTGSVFCQGIDLMLLEPGSDVTSLMNAMRNMVRTLSRIEKPVIVGVQGAAIGLGVCLLPLCDVILASDTSTFWTPYGKLGQGLEAAASYTFPLIGKSLVSELIYKGSRLTAEEAHKLGLVTEVVPAAMFSAKLSQVAAQVATNSKGLIMAKSQLRIDHQERIEEALDTECAALEDSWSSAAWLSAAAESLAMDFENHSCIGGKITDQV